MRRTRTRILLALLLLLAAGAFFGHRALKAKGHPGLPTFLGQLWRNYPKSFQVEPPVIHIQVDDAALERLQAVVEKARERGVIMPEGNSYVNADVQAPEGASKARVRIKGKMSDHVEGDKWSFRVIARKGGGFLGMKRFSLQHPGTRNYLAEWFYHQLMAGEGLVALRYGFCRVVFNGEDLGVYAYEEHFGPELLENNARMKGPLVRFDPGLFWQHRLNGVEGLGYDDGYGDEEAAALDAFGTGDLEKDPKANRVFEQAMTLMDAFRRGQLAPSEVFDPERTGRRLALLDLLGGHRSMDWSDVKFYFDPVAQRFEPVSYESVSGFPLKELAGAFRVAGPPAPRDEFHMALLKDPVIFAAYIRSVERFARKEWLDSAFHTLQGPLDSASAIVYGEFPYKELDRGVYYRNQRVMQRALTVPKPFHAYREERSGDTVHFAVVPVNNLPVLVDSLLLPDGRAVPVLGHDLVYGRRPGRPGVPQRIAFLAPGVPDSLLGAEARITAHIPGASRRLVAEVFHQTLRPYGPSDFPVHQAPNAQDLPFLQVDPETRTVRTAPGTWTIDRDLVLPSGYTWQARAPLELRLVRGARIVVRGPMDWQGAEDAPIRLTGRDSLASALVVMDAERSQWRHVRLEGLLAAMFQRADLVWHEGGFHGTKGTLLTVATGEVELRGCTFEGGKDQVYARYAKVQMEGCVLQGAKDDALTVEGGSLVMNGSVVEAAGGVGLKAALAARVELDGSAVEAAGTALEVEKAANLKMKGGSIKAPRSVHAGKAEVRYGPVSVQLDGVRLPDGEGAIKVGAGSEVRIDGKAITKEKNTASE